ncbi:ricin-type beta-trefoil lectin domain protein [Streptomyces cellulosae]|uniref:ricin-type beta-trefoil lectin domain protein n=1 Tax=Streptomyces cellulosae TaxID=1968 RepID=UPI0004C6BCC1|nr:ricin-type beta-trefoil lectin domain protein [Streptomyces cellulosae]
MSTPHPPRPPYPPPGAAPEESDESLGAALRGRPDREVTHAVALLMARHWSSVHAYAAICLASPADTASMVGTAAFHQVLDRVALGETAVALRPRLLLAVRDTVRQWAHEERISGVLPDLGKPAGGRGMRTAKSMTPENRKLAERSFHALPGLSRCLLWHVEVEAEPLSVPAALLGMDLNTASAALEQAHEKFRKGCVHAHRELAPTKDCRFYNRLLDVPIRRGGALLPDVRHHLAQCRYCRNAAEQLGHFEGGLGVLIAEAVLGWGARRYLDTRPGRDRPEAPTPDSARHGGHRRRRRLPGIRGVQGAPGGSDTSGRTGAPGAFGGQGETGTPGEPGTAGVPGARGVPGTAGVPGTSGVPATPGVPAPHRRIPGGLRSSRTLLTGVGLASAGLLATVLVTGLWSGDDGVDPAASTSANGGLGAAPGTGSPSPPTASSGTARLPAAPGRTRLRDADADLCLDIKGEARKGAGTQLAACSAAPTQQWSYETDGLLRSVADPDLCLDSHLDAGVVVLGTCAAEKDKRGDDVRYDLTVRGEFLPRWDGQLALASSSDDAGADIVVKVRDGSDEQSWLTDPASTATPGSLSVTGTRKPSAPAMRLSDRV